MRGTIQVLGVALLVCGLAAWQKQGPPVPTPPPTPDEMSPTEYTVDFQTSGGKFTVAVHRDWAPHAADRFYNLVQHGYFDGNAMYRVVPKFVVQWGLNPDPAVTAQWLNADLPDDPPAQHNVRGYVTFARGNGPNSRTTQVFVNLGLNTMLDKAGFTPFGQVTRGLEVVEHVYPDYGEGPPNGAGPDQAQIVKQGAVYLNRKFPRLDHILKAQIESPAANREERR